MRPRIAELIEYIAEHRRGVHETALLTMHVTAARAPIEARAAMVSSLQNADGVCLEKLMQTHPVLGPLNMYHWVVALGLHDQRHAAQIREIGQSLAAS